MNRRLHSFVTSERGEYIISRLPAAVVLLCALFYVLSFVSMYSKPHAYESTSYWIYKNIPAGSTIAGVHWDDRLPLSLPEHSAHQYSFEGEEETLNLYEPDSQGKILQTLRRLSKADYLIFPTYRIPGSVPRLPLEYPWTTRFFNLLFADKLGFKLIQTFKDRPSLLGLQYDDDLADESFTVYDHPKVAIFKNVERLSTMELDERIQKASIDSLHSLAEIMTKNVIDGRLEEAPTGQSNVFDLLKWFAAIEILAFATLPLLVVLCSGLPDRGYGLSKTTGILFFGLLTWWEAAFHITNFSVAVSQSTALVLVLLALFICRRNVIVRTQCWSTIRKHWILVEGLFLGVSCIFLIIRFFNSEINWGEKPMDSTFLRFLTRLDTLPPQDPWAAGQTMHYYYLGVAFLASLLKLTSINLAVGYNLAIATVAGLIAVGVGSIALCVTKSKRWSALAAIGVVCVSNLETLRLWIVEGKPATFDTFWSSARVFTSPAFGEYTFWSLLFADLHAHVIAVPFTVLLVGALTALWIQSGERFRWQGIGIRIIVGLLYGFLYAGNTWDFISFGVIGGVIVFSAPYFNFWIPPSHGEVRPPLGERLLVVAVSKGVSLLWDATIILCAAATVMIPFAAQSGSTRDVGYGWVQSFELNSLKQVLLFAGHWLLIIIVSAACIVAATFRKPFSLKLSVIPAVCALYPIILAAFASMAGISSLPWGILVLSSILIRLGMEIALKDRESGVIGALVVGVGIIIATAELVFLIDRMNTIFKSYMCITLASAISALVLWRRASRLIGESDAFRGMVFESRLGLHLANTICVILPLIGSIVNVIGILSMQRVPVRKYTLDGMAYFESVSGEEFELVNWLNKHIDGTPVTLEAQGDSYQDYTRIAMHTGLPTVMGWDYHVTQRGTPHQAVEQRKRDVREIYSTEDLDDAEKLLLEYNVDLVIVGKIERRIYPARGLAKFNQAPDRFPILYRNGDTTVYATRHSSFNPRRGSRTRSVFER